MGKKSLGVASAAESSRKSFLKKPQTPMIIVTASSDDSNDLDYDYDRPFNGRSEAKATPQPVSADLVRIAPPEAEIQSATRESHRRWVLALALLMIYIALVIASSQLTSSAFHDSETKQFKAPYLFIWCKVFLRWLAFPSVFCIQLCLRCIRRQPLGAKDMWQHCTKALRSESGRISFRLMLWKFLPMSTTMLFMQIGWVVGLVYAPASIVTALCAGTVALSYLLSWLILKNKMLLVKGLFVIVAFVGIGLISVSSVFVSELESSMHPANVTNGTFISEPEFSVSDVAVGVFCGVGAAVFYSLHQLTFKLAYPKADFLQVSLIMSVMSIFICVIFLPVPIIMNQLGKEIWNFARMPWSYMVLAWSFSYISSISYAYGLALSNPFFMSVAEVAIVAFSTCIDAFIRKIALADLQIAGTVLIAVAFIFMVMPDDWLSVRVRKVARVDKPDKENGKADADELAELNPAAVNGSRNQQVSA